jgi:hypothetical protein
MGCAVILSPRSFSRLNSTLLIQKADGGANRCHVRLRPNLGWEEALWPGLPSLSSPTRSFGDHVLDLDMPRRLQRDSAAHLLRRPCIRVNKDLALPRMRRFQRQQNVQNYVVHSRQDQGTGSPGAATPSLRTGSPSNGRPRASGDEGRRWAAPALWSVRQLTPASQNLRMASGHLLAEVRRLLRQDTGVCCPSLGI